MISRGVKRAWKKAGVKKSVFHNYRNTALTNWSEKGIPVDIAMQASGHTSVQTHKRYVALRPTHISNAFGLLEMVNTNGKQEDSDDKATASK
jgi:integrase